MAAKKSAKSTAAGPDGAALGNGALPSPATGDISAVDVATASATPGPGRPMHKSVGWALTVLARLHRVELGEQLSALGLFPGQEQLLQALHDNESMTMGALAEFMRVRPPTASKAVVRLSAQGLVERVVAAGDGRVVRVRLTDEGRARANELAALWRVAERKLLDGFDQRDRRRLRKFLRRAADNFSAMAAAPATVAMTGDAAALETQ